VNIAKDTNQLIVNLHIFVLYCWWHK